MDQVILENEWDEDECQNYWCVRSPEAASKLDQLFEELLDKVYESLDKGMSCLVDDMVKWNENSREENRVDSSVIEMMGMTLKHFVLGIAEDWARKAENILDETGNIDSSDSCKVSDFKEDVGGICQDPFNPEVN